MKLPVKYQKRLLLIWAFAIGWFYIGSLINFHQHHIWGKSLIPQINECSRNKSKTAPGLGNDETIGFHQIANDFVSDKDIPISFSFNEPGYLIVNLHPLQYHPFIPDRDGSAFSQLRGPPQV
jgi:hypothetical protein